MFFCNSLGFLKILEDHLESWHLRVFIYLKVWVNHREEHQGMIDVQNLSATESVAHVYHNRHYNS